uniref:Uncharacterized protein n=1 Tax=Cacopsylla melanoneura TaxID=428564 RepID=A0A8D8Q674_9HEMI
MIRARWVTLGAVASLVAEDGSHPRSEPVIIVLSREEEAWAEAEAVEADRRAAGVTVEADIIRTEVETAARVASRSRTVAPAGTVALTVAPRPHNRLEEAPLPTGGMTSKQGGSTTTLPSSPFTQPTTTRDSTFCCCSLLKEKKEPLRKNI